MFLLKLSSLNRSIALSFCISAKKAIIQNRKNYIYKNIITILYCLCISPVFAQEKSTSINGYIKDTFGNPIAGAVISALEPVVNTVSDVDGFYKIDKLSNKSIILKVRALGYLEYSREIVLTSNKANIHDVLLKESDNFMNEVTVIGKSANQERIHEIKRSGFNVDVIDMGKYANQTANINQVLRTAPGVTFREDGGLGSNFMFRINGLAAKIYIDGIPMENFGSSMTLNNIPVNLIDRVEVYKGVVPAFLGSDALGGAVNIVTKQRSRHYLDLSHSYGSFNTNQSAIVGMYTNPKTKLSLKLNGFYNHSDNNYKMYSEEDYNVILEKTENNKFVKVDKVRRFYDKYTSGMGQLEVGLRDKKWADQFFVGLTYSKNHKQNQLGVTINSVNGGSWSESEYVMPTVSYKKQNFLVNRLFADMFASTSYDVSHFRDTALYNYDWSANWIQNSTGETPNIPVHNRFNSQNHLARLNFNYDFDEDRNHSLNLNYNFNNNQRKSYDMISNNNLSGLPSRLARHIIGLSWQSQWFEKRLVNNLAVKFYGLDTYKQVDERVYDSNYQLISGSVVKYGNFFGYYSASLASRYRLTTDGGIKLSLERAYNMPNVTGLLGDGQNTIGNWDLKPERSDNLNVGYYWNLHFKEGHFINLDVSGFYRLAKDYLNLKTVAQDGTNYFQYENVPGVKLYGFESEIKYGYKDIVAVSINGTYDKAFHNNKYTDETNQHINLSYGHQLENRPWLYGNGEITLAKSDVFKKGNRMQLSYNYQYTKWFYLTLAHLGSLATKDYVPTQNIHSATLSYSWNRNKYNISFEGRNLTDERAYDNFRLQRPGIAFYTKFRISIM